MGSGVGNADPHGRSALTFQFGISKHLVHPIHDSTVCPKFAHSPLTLFSNGRKDSGGANRKNSYA